MNVWRWLGLFFFLAAVTCFISTQAPSFAGDKGDKDKTAKDKADAGKDKGDKDKVKVDKDKSDKDKTDKDKGDKKPEPAKGGSEEFKFTGFDSDKKPFFQEVKTTTLQTMKVMGQEVKQDQDQTFWIKWTPKEKKGGNFVVEQQVVAVKMNIDIGGNKIAFDSTAKTTQKNPMTDFFEALMDQKLTFEITPDMSIKSIEGRQDFIKKLSDTNPAIKTLLDQIMSENALKRMAEPTWWAVPDKAVAKGETWNKKSELDLGPIGKYDTDFKFTYEGQDQNKQFDKIKIDATLAYTQPKGQGGLPFTIKAAALKGSSTGGEAEFDRKKGRIAQSSLKMDLSGTLTIEVGNMATEISLDQKQTSVTKTFDDLPAEAKAKSTGK